ncbi:MAG: heavy metal translocating P-type ATPase [Sphaerochaetaceae bacterium]|nr:heavy metal translocating P-type ATPase [Sphaerochaetaceae bacterium]
MKITRIHRIIVSLFLFVLGLTLLKDFKLYIMLIAYIIIGHDIIIKAIKNIFKGSFLDETFLMAIASIGAFIIGSSSEGVAVILFFQIGEAFESYAVNKSKRSIKSLMSLKSEVAHLVENSTIVDKDPTTIKIGDIILVKPGERIALDGIVIEGNSALDVSPLTGEALPLDVSIKSTVLSGSLNINSPLKVKVTKSYENSTISRILELVESANEKKSKNEIFIKKFAKYYTPIVVYSALLLATIPPLFVSGVPYSTWIYRALMFLVVSCPCAFVVSIPLSYFSGIGAISKKGVLVKGSIYLENLAKVDTIVFDKTGTLTEGKFTINNILCSDIEKIELLNIVSSVERLSTHPIANSIVKEFETLKDSTIKDYIAKDVKEIPGQGLKATVNNKEVLVGKKALLEDNNVAIKEYENLDTTNSLIYISINNEFKAIISIGDKIKANSKETIKKLRKNGLNNLVMLSGDNFETAEKVATDLGLSDFKANLLPEDKVKELDKIIKQGHKVAFVGDGINDSPALAMSEVGISMGAAGSDAAIEASDVVIMGEQLNNLSSVIRLSKKTMRIVKENAIFAIGIKFLVMILGALGLANMWAAVFADVGVTFLAVLNALRMLSFKSNKI